MKRKIFASLAAIMVVVALKHGLLTALWMFLLVGAVPGTHYSVPSGVMLIIYGLTIWAIFCQRTAWRLLRPQFSRSTIKQRLVSLVHKARRYSSV